MTMKHIIYLSAIILAITSCTTKLHLPDEPQVVNQGISAVTVTIPSIQLIDDATSQVIPGNGTHVWSNSESLGITDCGEDNFKFILRKQYDGTSGESAEFYGEPVFGKLLAYIPWSETPITTEKAEQKYYADAYEHFMKNSMLQCSLEEANHLDFAYSGGLLKVVCKENLGIVDFARISSGDWTTTVTDIDLNCSESSPLTLWVKIPAGKYTNLNVTYNSGNKKVSIPAPGEFTVADFHCVNVDARQQTYYDGIDPFTGEDSSYSDKPLDY